MKNDTSETKQRLVPSNVVDLQFRKAAGSDICSPKPSNERTEATGGVKNHARNHANHSFQLPACQQYSYPYCHQHEHSHHQHPYVHSVQFRAYLRVPGSPQGCQMYAKPQAH
eukprot:1157743-Pelagomonas_calceolata.AAC.2